MKPVCCSFEHVHIVVLVVDWSPSAAKCLICSVVCSYIAPSTERERGKLVAFTKLSTWAFIDKDMVVV